MNGPGPVAVSDQQHVSWLELFFDLVFVAWLTLVNSTLMEQPRSSILLGIYAAVGSFTIWMLVTVINNREPDQGFIRTACMVALMLLVLLVALTIRPDDGLRTSLGSLLLGGVYLTCAVMVLDLRHRAPRSRLTVPIGLLVAAAAICFLRAPTIDDGPDELYRLGIVAVAASALAAVAMVLLVTARALPGHPVRSRHLDERWGQLIIIILGEGILVLGEVAVGRTSIAHPGVFVLMFMTMFGFWRLYFDSAMRVRVTESVPVFTLLTGCHLLLIFGLMTSFDFFAQALGVQGAPAGEFLIGAAALSLAFAALAAIVIVRRGLCAVAVVNAVTAAGFLAAGVIAQHRPPSLPGFVTVCLLIVATYAAGVRLVDPLARPLVSPHVDRRWNR